MTSPTPTVRDLPAAPTLCTRRRVLEWLGVGFAGAPLLMLPGRANARTGADGGVSTTGEATSGEETTQLDVFAPYAVGSVLLGAEIVRMEDASRGMARVQLRKPSGDLFRVELYARDDQGPSPVAGTRHYALFLANGGRGDKRTNEREGLTLYALADAVRANESRVDPLPVISMRTRWERDRVGP